MTGSSASPDGGGWRIEAGEEGFLARLLRRGQSIALFEVPAPGKDEGLLVYRAGLRAEGLKGGAFLEMWCRLRERGEFFSRGSGFGQVLEGPSDWVTLETPFLLRKGERPDRVRLGLVVEGSGRLWVRDVELLFAPLAHPNTDSG